MINLLAKHQGVPETGDASASLAPHKHTIAG